MPLCLSLHDRSPIVHFHPGTQDTLIATCQGLWVNFRDFTSLPFLRADSSSDTSVENGLPWFCGIPRAAAPAPEQSLLSTWSVSCLPSFHLISKEAHGALFPTMQSSREKREEEPPAQDHSRLYLAQFDLTLLNLGNKLLAPLRVGKKSTCPSVPDPALSKQTNPLLNYLNPKQLF